MINKYICNGWKFCGYEKPDCSAIYEWDGDKYVNNTEYPCFGEKLTADEMRQICTPSPPEYIDIMLEYKGN